MLIRNPSEMATTEPVRSPIAYPDRWLGQNLRKDERYWSFRHPDVTLTTSFFTRSEHAALGINTGGAPGDRAK